MRFPAFIGPSYALQSVNIDAQRCLNFYPEVNELGTGKEKEFAALIGTPGLRLLATAGSGPIRGLYTANNGSLFAVSGNSLYSLDSSWTVSSSLGTLVTTAGPVSMVDNGLQLMTVDGSNGYAWTLASSTFQQITDPNFYAADQVVVQDGYFIFNKKGTGQFFISALNGDTFDALDIGTAEGLADILIGLISDQRNLYLHGTNSTEVFYDSGATFPFERIQGAFIPLGCEAAFTIERMAGAIYWLGRDEKGRGIVYRAQGYQPTRISNHALETILKGLGDLSTARAWTYQQGGHGFYCLNLPGASTTWVFDAVTSLWHERSYLSNGVISRHRADCHAFAYNTNVVGDYETGRIYALDPDYYSDNGAEILGMRAAPHISKEMKQVMHQRFQLDVEAGVGLDGGVQGSDPQVALDWSDDGGHTWSNEHWTSIGRIGKTKNRAIFRRLGVSRDRVYRIKITDKVKRRILGADVTLEEGTS